MIDAIRTEALAAAKSATGAYARNPTDANAARVEAAWRAVRRLDTVSVRRLWREGNFKATPTKRKP